MLFLLLMRSALPLASPIADETHIHQELLKYRVFGEWFEIKPSFLGKELYIHKYNRASDTQTSYQSNFWWKSFTLNEEIDRQLNRLIEGEWGKEKYLLREELMNLTKFTLVRGDKKSFYDVVEHLLLEGLSLTA